MLHKRYFVALLCGALCLVGCLKNEESPSVTQVRNAKANELNAQAKLLEAQAAAQTTLAAAEAKLKEAQAELAKANAALVKAQAQYEEVRAELLGVEVKLQMVKVDEEKVELQKKQAELEILLEQVKVAKAEAEAEIQRWVNELNQLKAAAQVQAINAQKELLEAQQAMEEYMAKAEADKAEDMRAYIMQYFEICQVLVELQKEAIDMELAIDGYINGVYDELDLIEDDYNDLVMTYNQVAALEAYLEQFQTKTAEEIEAELAEAYDVLNEKLTAWGEAFDALDAAQDAFWNYTDEKASFYYNEDNEDAWDDAFINYLDMIAAMGTVPGFAVVPVPYAENEGFLDEPATVYGYWKIDEESGEEEFVPLYKYEEYLSTPVLYEIDFENGIFNPTRGQLINQYKISAAAIHVENINAVLDEHAAALKEIVNAAKEVIAEWGEATIAQNEEQIEMINETLDVQKEYVELRATEVQLAEEALVMAFDSYNEAVESYYDARNEYRDYMIVNYDIKRTYFENVYNDKDNLAEAYANYSVAKADLDEAESKVPTDEQIYKADLAAAEKEAAYNTAKKTYDDGGTAAALVTATGAYNDAVADQEAKKGTYDAKLAAWRDANVAYTADPSATNKELLDNAKTALDTAESELKTADTALATAKKTYDEAKAADDKAKEPVEKAKEAMDEAKEIAADLKAYVVDPLVIEAEALAAGDTLYWFNKLAADEEALAAAFEALEQEGVAYEDDPNFELLYAAYKETGDAINALGPWWYYDPDLDDYVPGAAMVAINNLNFLYYTVYRNKDGYDGAFNYQRAAYDVEPNTMFYDGYDWDDNTIVPRWTYYYTLWEEVEPGVWEPVYEEDGVTIAVDPTYSNSYIVAQLQEEIDNMPEAVAEEQAEIDEAMEPVFEEIEGVREMLQLMDSWKPAYASYVAEKQELYDAVNEAEKAEIDAHWAYLDAKAYYQGLEYSLTDWVYFYDEDLDELIEEYGLEEHPYYYCESVQEYIAECEEYLAYLEGEIDATINAYNAVVDEANTWLDKKYMDYDLLLKRIAVLEEIAARYEALIEELFGIDLSTAVE
jgi:hypothetical protein